MQVSHVTATSERLCLIYFTFVSHIALPYSCAPPDGAVCSIANLHLLILLNDSNVTRYAYANQGNQPCNDQFSNLSISSMSAAIADRAACMVVSANPVCGNGLIESNATGPTDTAGYEEVCDGGNNAADTCCKSGVTGNDCLDSTPGGAALKTGMDCSPRSVTFGSCCTSSCAWKPQGELCGVESECVNAGVCTLRQPGEVHNGSL